MTEKNNNLSTVFEGNDVQIIVDENDELLFELYSTGAALGYARPNAKGMMYPRKDRIDTVIENAEISMCVRSGHKYLTESQLYDFMLEAHTDKCKPFRKWVTNEVLPTIRKTGCYITESATEEAIDYQSKYGLRRIRKTFTESTDERKTYEEYLELSKAEYKSKRISCEDRIKASKIIIDSLEQKVADNISDMRGSELLAIQELLTDINKDLRILCNRRNGGKLAAKTKELNILNNYLPDINEGYLIEKAPFSENYMYESKMFSKDLVKTSAYKKWISNLHLEQYLPKTLDNVDFTEPLSIWIYYGCMDKFDIANLGKAIIDQIAKYYNFDDKQVVEFHPILNEYVSSYQESYMFVCIKNV